jgi:CRISPR/Cas system-associated exonuclease Cas4 (RecB family)
MDGIVKFSHREVVSILKHSLISGLPGQIDNELVKDILTKNMVKVPADIFSGSGLLKSIFRKPQTPPELSLYFKEILSLIANSEGVNKIESGNGQIQSNILNEYIYRIVLSINKLETIVNSPEISFSPETYFRILDRLLRMQSVPFSGEPLSGIQIMGILETRALDFRNLIILSVNEGILPAASSGSSFIPFSLREAFGVPSVNHQESIYAYHFYRLLQRAENVTFLYNSSSEGLQTGEMSRFLIQMKYDDLLRPVFTDLGFEIKSHAGLSDRIERNEEHIRQLHSLYTDKKGERILSPSAINTWLGCRMKFYYRYVERLKEPDDISLEIDPAMLGNILHETMRKLYEPFSGSTITPEMISLWLNDTTLLSKNINSAVNEAFKAGRNDEPGGSELIVRDVLLIYLKRVLNTDRSIAPVIILSLEKPFSFLLPVEIGAMKKEIIIGGNIDRIDSVKKVTRIVDYKTGIVSESIGSISDLFVDDRKKDSDAWLQTLVYCEACLATKPGSVLMPSVYKIRKLSNSSTGDMLKIKTGSHSEILIDNYETVREEFLSGLKGLIAIIFSDNEPFIKTSDVRLKCTFCPYKTLCMR